MIDVNLIGAPAFAVAVEGDRFVYTGANTRLLRVMGIAADQFLGRTPHEALPEAAARHIEAHYRLCVTRGEALDFEDVYELRGVARWWQTTVTPVFDRDDGRVASLIGVAIDVTDRKRAEREHREASARMALVMEVLDGGFWHFDLRTEVFSPSAKLIKIVTGEDRPTLDWSDYLTFLHADDIPNTDISTLVLGRAETMVSEYRVLSPGRQIKWLQCRRQLVRTEAGRPDSVVGVVVDISEQKRVQALLQQRATTDALTKLYNRRGFDECAELYAAGAAAGLGVGLLLVDLDRFKPVNDRFGHAIGDVVLREVARRLVTQVRSVDVVARLGGDEFAILVSDIEEGAMAELAARIVDALSLPVSTTAGPVTIGASVGCACTRERDMRVADLVARADRALYDIKDNGRGAWGMAA